MVGLVTLVIILVDSVTSTCFLSSFGDMITFSGPILAVSSGAFPGQSSTTRGFPTPAWDNPRRKNREKVVTIVFIVVILPGELKPKALARPALACASVSL